MLVCKGVWGTLSKENDGSLAATQAPLLFPPGMTSVSDPYVEVGFGVENIFRLLRVDFIWRVTHRDPETRAGDPEFRRQPGHKTQILMHGGREPGDFDYLWAGKRGQL